MECIVDSGCTSHYIQQNNDIPQRATDSPISVVLPNGEVMTSTITTNLKIPSATEKGNQAHMFPNLKSGNLLSVGQLCDDGYKVTFTNRKVTFTKNNETKFEGNRNQTNGMWTLQFPDQKANNLIPLNLLEMQFVLCTRPVLALVYPRGARQLMQDFSNIGQP